MRQQAGQAQLSCYFTPNFISNYFCLFFYFCFYFYCFYLKIHFMYSFIYFRKFITFPRFVQHYRVYSYVSILFVYFYFSRCDLTDLKINLISTYLPRFLNIFFKQIFSLLLASKTTFLRYTLPMFISLTHSSGPLLLVLLAINRTQQAKLSLWHTKLSLPFSLSLSPSTL